MTLLDPDWDQDPKSMTLDSFTRINLLADSVYEQVRTILDEIN